MREERQRASLVWPALVALIAILAYVNTLSLGFALDDLPLVRDDPRIRALGDVPRLFTLPYWPEAGGAAAGLYRPVTAASFALNRALLGADPPGFHLVNVLLHAAVSALAWFALRRAGVHYGTALLGGLLFAVHPVHTEAVANVAGRAEVLAALWVLGAWLAHRRASDATSGRSRFAWAVGAGVFYLFAVLSKESALGAPALFVVDDLLRGSERRRTADGVGWVYGLYAALLVAALAARFHALGGLRGAEDAAFIDNPAATAGTFARMATASWVQVLYATLTLWPASLSSDYSFDAIPTVASPGDPRFLFGVAFTMLLVLLVLVLWKRSRPTVLGLSIWIVFFLPTSNLFFATGTLMAERLVYLPSLGACLVAGHLGAWAMSLGRRSRLGAVRWAGLLVAMVGILSGLVVRSWTRNPVWKDNATLALHDVAVMPRSAKLHAGAAIVLHERGDTREAEEHYRRSLSIYADYAQMHYNLGILLAERGKTDEAIEHLMRAATISPGNPRPFRAVADLLERAGRVREAADARLNLGRALLAAGRGAEAERVLSRLATEAPRELVGRLALALLEEARGQTAEAIALYRVILEESGLSAETRSGVERRMELLRPGQRQ